MSINPKMIILIIKEIGKYGPIILETASKLHKSSLRLKEKKTKEVESIELSRTESVGHRTDITSIRNDIQSHVQVINNHTRVLKKQASILDTHADNLEAQAKVIEQLADENRKLQLAFRYLMGFSGIAFLISFICLVILIIKVYK